MLIEKIKQLVECLLRIVTKQIEANVRNIVRVHWVELKKATSTKQIIYHSISFTRTNITKINKRYHQRWRKHYTKLLTLRLGRSADQDKVRQCGSSAESLARALRADQRPLEPIKDCISEIREQY